MNNSKTNPAHYRRGSIEPWDFIVANDLGFLEGNIIKYLVRAGHKDAESRMDDLAKAATYLRKLIETQPDDSDDTDPRLDGASNPIPEDHAATRRNLQPGDRIPAEEVDLRGVRRIS